MSGMVSSIAESMHGEGSAQRRLSALLFRIGVALYLAAAAVITVEAAVFVTGAAPSPLSLIEASVGPICHHLPERTMSFAARGLPVCARCTGLWLGWIVAGLYWLGQRALSRSSDAGRSLPKDLTLAGLFATAATLALLEAVGALALGNLTRAATGMPLGLLPAWLLLTTSAETTIRRIP